MDWEKTSINIKMANEKYKKGSLVRNFNHIVQEPTQEQITLFIEGLTLLTDGDKFVKAEISKHEALVAE